MSNGTSNIPICPKCGTVMEAVVENNGYDWPEGPPHYDITYYCPSCGYVDDETEEQQKTG